MNVDDREGFLTFSAGFLLALLIVTVVLAALVDVRPMTMIRWSLVDVAIGCGAAMLMMLCFGFVGSVRKQAQEVLGPMLVLCRWYDFILLAIFVGIVEELLFRGVLEQWAARLDPAFALVAVNVLFGLLHMVTWEYALIAGLLGGVLSLLAYYPGDDNLLRPIVAHAVYDYIGFLWITADYRRHQGDGEGPREEQTVADDEKPREDVHAD